MRNSPTADQNTFYRFRYIHEQMSSPTSQIVVHHIMCVTRVCRPPHPNGILPSTIQTRWALFSINTTLTAIHMHLISQFACKQSTFQSVRGHNLRIKSRSGDGSRHLGMWWTIVLHISWSTVIQKYREQCWGQRVPLSHTWVHIKPPCYHMVYLDTALCTRIKGLYGVVEVPLDTRFV